MTAVRSRQEAAELIEEIRRDQPQVVRLAEALCLAAHAEPELVRRARLTFLPSSGLAVEAMLWFSPLVEAADSRALVLDPGIAAELRRELAAHRPAELAAVRAFTEAGHRQAPPAVRAFERLLWAAVDPALPEEAVRRELEPFERALAREDGSADEVGRWVLHFLPRLPARVRDTEAAWRLRVAAAERLGLDLPEEMTAGHDRQALVAARTLVRGQVAVGVRLTSDGVLLSRPPARDARVCTVAGAARARVALRGALPGAGLFSVDLYDGQQAALRLDVVARLLPDGTVAEARVEMESGVLCAHGGHGDGRAVAVDAGGVTALRLEGGERSASARFDGPPGRLAVTAEGDAAAVSTGGGTVRLLTLGPDGGPLTEVRTLEREPAALGWVGTAEGPLLCTAQGRRLVLHRAGGETAASLDHPAELVRLWCSSAGSRLAAVDASGRVHLWRCDDPAAPRREYTAEPDGPVTALTGDPRSGLVCWAVAGGAVRLWEPATGTVREPAVLPRPATGLALWPGGDGLWAADGGPRLMGMDPRSGAPRPPADGPGGRPLPFGLREVHLLGDGGLLLTGTGGPVEIRSEDGRTQVAAPDPAPPGSGGGPRWLRDAVGLELAPEALGEEEAATLLRTARAAGVCHLLVDGEALRRTEGLLARIARQAAAAGLRLVADLAPPSAPAGEETAAARLGTLEAAAALLEHADGLRLLRGRSWPAELVAEVRHLVDAYPDAALLAAADRLPDGSGDQQPPAALAPCHLVVSPAAPDRGTPPKPPGPGVAWALPSRPPGGRRPPVRSALLLAQPGCREVPFDLLAETPEARWLRGLLSVRTQQLALARGTAETVDPGTPDVVALRRRHHDEEVLCLTNTADRAAAALVPCRPGEAALLEIASHRAGEDVAQPSVLHPRSGRFEVPVRPGRARWFRVLDTADAVAHGLADGGPGPTGS